MKIKSFALIAAVTAAGFLSAQSANAADEWGIEYEEKARVEAKVVDLLCEVTGDCVEQCGAGTRQLGLLLDDGTLVPAVKNFDPFAGTTDDLIQFCGKRIVADGLMIKDPLMPMFVVQFRRLAPDGEWGRANNFTKNWAKSNPDKPANQWFRHDAEVLRLVETQGVYGIPGLKAEE
ncbi:hypothetical protein [Pelagibius sp. Alg239-R121]|uniref:hypothetical protein n=1 Tax=Pelagibius sp. Alg239-R121 TaxID=2993448 RepID=UPI0024A77CF5|nr:hypothetical protein [Pelagibius sp. Alg239-R121]